MIKVSNGSQVKVHYRGTLDDGTEFDSSYSRGEPIGFTVGSGEMIDGFDTAVVGMTVGETKSFSLEPSQAYGDVNPDAFTQLGRDAFPEDFPISEGGRVPLTGPDEQQLIGVIKEFDDKSVTIDLNHPMAGKNLNFEIELVDVDE